MKEPLTVKNGEKRSVITGGSIMEGVQESTFYSMNQSQDDRDKRASNTPLTQVESIYCKIDPTKLSLKKAGDRHGTNLGSQPRKGKKNSKFLKL